MCKPSQATTALACSAKTSVLASCVLTPPSRVNFGVRWLYYASKPSLDSWGIAFFALFFFKAIYLTVKKRDWIQKIKIKSCYCCCLCARVGRCENQIKSNLFYYHCTSATTLRWQLSVSAATGLKKKDLKGKYEIYKSKYETCIKGISFWKLAHYSIKIPLKENPYSKYVKDVCRGMWVTELML